MSIRYFSMFSGIGGFELGIEQAAQQLGLTVDCVGYSEIDKPAIATYEEHFEHRNFGDATTIDAGSLPDFDLLVGGFPCQAFSIAAKRPRNFILENVKGLLSHDGGRTARTIIETITGMGYCVEWQVLNSKDLGVPQNRERIYIVGHLGAVPERTVFPFAGSTNPYSTVGFTAETAVARTFTAGGNSGGNHSGMTIIREPGGDRRLTITEAERLQGFPDGWTVGKDTPRYKQCGNAVTVNVVRAVALRLYEREAA